MLALLCALATAAPLPPPRLTALAQIAVAAPDLARARTFYTTELGLEEASVLRNADGSLRAVLDKVDQWQTIELQPSAAAAGDPLVHISFETSDAEGFRRLLESRGVSVPVRVTPGRVTACYFQVRDPEGRTVEIVQLRPRSWMEEDLGRHLPAARLAVHLRRVGIPVRHEKESLRFYRDQLGLVSLETGRGLTVLRVPGGGDELELDAASDAERPVLVVSSPGWGPAGTRVLTDPEGLRIRLARP